MAGDWIKMRAELFSHPKFLALSRELIYGEDHGIIFYACTPESIPIGAFPPSNESVTERALRSVTEASLRDVTLIALLKVWCSINTHCKVENLDAICDGIDLLDLDSIAGFSGFGEALASVAWVIEDTGRNRLVFPNFLEFNEPACLRMKPMSGAERAARHRAKKIESQTRRQGHENERVTKVTKRNDREEKRREEKSEEEAPPLPPHPILPEPKNAEERAAMPSRPASMVAVTDPVQTPTPTPASHGFPLTHEGLAQSWCFYCTRRRLGVTRDSPLDMATEFAELVRQGLAAHGIMDAIESPDRDRGEYFWQFKERLLGGKNPPESMADKFKRARKEMEDMGLWHKNGSIDGP